MKRLILIGAVFTSGAVLFACSSYCSSLASFNPATKLGNCDAGQGVTITFSPPCKNTAACQTAYNSCSSADQTKLNNDLSCLQGVPNCTAGQEAAFFNAYLSCIFSALDGGISQACQAAFVAVASDAGC